MFDIHNAKITSPHFSRPGGDGEGDDDGDNEDDKGTGSGGPG